MKDTQHPISIGFVTRRDAANPRSWSGIVYHMAQALEARGEGLHYIGPMDDRPLRRAMFLERLRRRLGAPETLPRQSRKAARLFARQIDGALRESRPDVLFAPAGSALVSELRSSLPVVYTSDATFALMQSYYPKYSRLAARARRQADTLERRTIARSDLLVYPTRWVADSAIRDYGADPGKVHVIPYGCNLEAPTREAALADRPEGPVRLLFVGVDWARKGGDIAVEALETLNRRGIDAELTVIGCTPPERVSRRGLTVIPFLDKNDPLQARQLSEQYLRADVFVLPTRQECFGIVFCEAAAHGVPTIATATGGVPDVVHEGVNGHTLPPEARGEVYADRIESIVVPPGVLQALRRSTRDDYEARLNWSRWADEVGALMRQSIGSASQRS